MSGEASLSATVSVTGRLTIATSGLWLKKALAQKTAAHTTLTVDLAGVTEVDSSALAFVTSLGRLMAAQNCKVDWLNVPAVMHGVAAIYGADAVFSCA